MVRQVEAEDILLKYLSSISSDFKCAVGLILGQASSHKFHVLHLAKTPPYQTDQDKTEQKPLKNIASIAEINEAWLADHAKQATRMLPGGMHVLGAFLVTDEDLFSPFSAKIKSILMTIEQNVQTDKYLFGGSVSDKLVLSFAPKSQRCLAKTYNVASALVQPADLKFLPKVGKFIGFECTYQIEHVYNLKKGEANGPLRQHIKVILDDINAHLESGVILFDNELKDVDEKLENANKKKKIHKTLANKLGQDQAEPNGLPVPVSIFEKCFALEPKNSLSQGDGGGQIRIIGEVASKLWMNPKGTFGEAIQALREDIMRSLAARMEMHWDSLTEEELGEDVNSVHEPPRRVLISLPESSVCVSDYLFPGEGPDDVKVSLEELLDIKSDASWELLDLEGQADITQYFKDTSPPEPEADPHVPKIGSDSSKFMYFLGLLAAILILLVSIFVHFYLKYV